MSGPATTLVMTATATEKPSRIATRRPAEAVRAYGNIIEAYRYPPMSVGSSSRPTTVPVRSDSGSGAITVVVNVRPLFLAASAKPPRT